VDADPGPSLARRVLLEEHMEAGERWSFAGGEVAAFSRRSPARTTSNEDAAAVLPVDERSGVLVVADGVGGQAEGARAARAAVEALAASVAVVAERRGRDESAPGDLRDAILDGVETADREVRALGTGAATTLVAVEIQDAEARSYHVGDSAAVIVGQRGRLKFRTVAHSPVGYALEAGLLDEREAMVHEDLHLVSNAVGAGDMHIGIGPSVSVAPRDTVLLATDGLFDNLPLRGIVDRIRKGALDLAVEGLARECQARMVSPRENQPSKPDDLTFLLWRRATRPVRSPG